MVPKHLNAVRSTYCPLRPPDWLTCMVPTHGARNPAAVGALTGRVSAGRRGGRGGRGKLLGWHRGMLADFCYVCICVAAEACDIVAEATLGLPVHAHFACCSALWRRGRPAMALGRQCALCCVHCPIARNGSARARTSGIWDRVCGTVSVTVTGY